MLYKIGDFSKLLNVSIRTLRYYDEINIFMPIEIDIYTNYRYYSQNQIEEFNIIKKLKDIGFTLDEIKKYQNNFTNEIMLNKKTKLMSEIKKLKEEIKEIDKLRSCIINGKISYDYKVNVVNKKKSIF